MFQSGHEQIREQNQIKFDIVWMDRHSSTTITGLAADQSYFLVIFRKL